MKFKIGDKARAIVSDPRVANTIVTITDAEKVMDIQFYIAQDTNGEKWRFSEDNLEFLSAYDFLSNLADEWRKLGKAIISKEEKNLKFTFYVKEGTRVDKSCNGTIPTMTTNIELSDGNVFDEITTIKGSATCDKADYDERQGVLEALANAVCGGEFEKRYKKAVKANKDADLWMRTCYYCGKVFDTVEEKVAHDDWHVECKKARRERYLLRKRAKEIAFEEQAQKMAKEMMGEQK